jgi:hypothetical protein
MIAFPHSEEFEVSTARWHGFCRLFFNEKSSAIISLSNLFDVPVGFGKQKVKSIATTSCRGNTVETVYCQHLV